MQTKEVILIQPPAPKSLQKEYLSVQIPLNLRYIAGSLISEGARVMVHDFVVERYNKDAFLGQLRKKQPVLIGFTSLSSSIPFVNLISKQIKMFDTGIHTILGGVHASALPLETLGELKHIDFIVVGEGEITIKELYKEILGNQDFHRVRGIAFRDKMTGKLFMTAKRELISDLNNLDFPAINLFEVEKYRKAHVSRGFSRVDLNIMELLTSRGCPQSCIFCAGHINYGQTLRFRSISNIIKEIERMRKIEHISIEDDTFTLNRSLVFELGNYLKSKGITWNCNARVGSIDKKLADDMVRNNCRKISLGIESGSERILKLSKKNITVSEILETFRIVRKSGIRYIEGNFMLGSHPDEKIEDIALTEKLIFSLKPDFITLTIMCPFPGTEAYEIMSKRNLFPERKNWLNFNLVTHKLPYKQLFNLSADKLLYQRNRILKRYYTSPKYILRQITHVRNFNEIKYLLRLAKTVTAEGKYAV